MNWKKLLAKPFKVGDIVTSGSNKFDVIKMEDGRVTIKEIDTGNVYTDSEEKYFKLLKRVK